MNNNLSITLTAPDDWHCHLRDGNQLARTVTDLVRQFKRAIVMPNLSPPITDVISAEQYRQQIVQYVPKNYSFTPLMTLYLTDATTPNTIVQAHASRVIYACKLYPAGATTGSHAGVKNLRAIYPALEMMQQLDMPLLIHGEIADPALDIFDRETDFIDNQLTQLIHDFPALRMVFEHVSSKIAVDFILNAPDNIAATITVHHLLFNRNIMLTGGVHPHYYCLPILKTAQDQQALIQAAISGHKKFFLGTDSAPHALRRKECASGAAGIYSGYCALELYAQVFAEHQALAQLENFASLNGARFYKLPPNEDKITLIKEDWIIPERLPFGDDFVVPLWAGKTLEYKIKNT